MSERQGLLGAMPVGERWRAQGYINGNTRYFGTFDTEEDAHRVFMTEKERVENERLAEAAKEVERILAGTTFVYAGGVGRGASLNGKLFKVIADKDEHAALVVPILSDGSLAFDAQRTVLKAYLREQNTAPTLRQAVEAVITQPPATPPAAAVTIDSRAREALRADIKRFIGRAPHRGVEWSVDFLLTHSRPKLAAVLGHITGTSGVQQQLEWLRTNTTLPSALIDEIENGITSGLYSDDALRESAKVFRQHFPEASSFVIDEDVEPIE